MKLSDGLIAALDNVPSGLCVLRLEKDKTHPLYYNRVCREALGLPADSFAPAEDLPKPKLHPEDAPGLAEAIAHTARTGEKLDSDVRVFSRRHQGYRWLHVDGKLSMEGDERLLFVSCSDISQQKQLESTAARTRDRLNQIVNSIPGGIATYQVEGERFITVFVSDGAVELSGYTRTEYDEIVRENALNLIYPPDRPRLLSVARTVLEEGKELMVSCRMCVKGDKQTWIHMDGRRVGEKGSNEISVVFTGLSPEARLFQRLANETADGIYVIDQQNYDLLYVNETKNLFARQGAQAGQKCYRALQGKDAPCDFCSLKTHSADGVEHDMPPIEGRYYSTRFREIDWNGIPAYVKYVRDVTGEKRALLEKERMERYFQTLVKNLPGGVVALRLGVDGVIQADYLSEGFAAMTGTSMEDAWAWFKSDILYGIHPEDRSKLLQNLESFQTDEHSRSISFRLKRGDGGYMWIKCNLSLSAIEPDGSRYIYGICSDMTREREEQAQLRSKYQELLLRHYRTFGPDTLILGHSSLSRNKVVEVLDYTGMGLRARLGGTRDELFTTLGNMLVNEGERKAFLTKYMSAPLLEAFARGETQVQQTGLIRLPGEAVGRYANFKLNLISAPDTGEVMGILTVSDVTEQEISGRILRSVSLSGYDLVVDANLNTDSYTTIYYNESARGLPPLSGKLSERIELTSLKTLSPKDRDAYRRSMNPEHIRERLERGGPYTFSFSLQDEKGEVLTKRVRVAPVDLRIGRVCLMRTDVTDSVREQQGLLNMLAYTFDLMGRVDVGSGRLTMYTRQTVLDNLPPWELDNYKDFEKKIAEPYLSSGGDEKEIEANFKLEHMLEKLEKRPGGYDFVLPFEDAKGRRYKQINVLWGDENRRTICIVRADVTDILAAERRSQRALEQALEMARKASRAKSDFLTSMSHDIRTPMNAIMGMTAIATAHQDEPARVQDCLHKISISSRYLLSLINDILDMSKIEREQVQLNHARIYLPELIRQLEEIIAPQAGAAGLKFKLEAGALEGAAVYGDPLRLNQILINLLGNAVKFTPRGGYVELKAERLPAEGENAARFRFIVKDSGVGISKEGLKHIFEPFFRSDSAAGTEGTGLGLSITHGLVNLMGGRIFAESKLGEGSVFTVELEFERAPEKKEEKADKGASATPEQGATLEGRHFLVAEDNAINAEILSEILKDFGASCQLEPNGSLAVEAFRNAPPGSFDAILMDIQMPKMNGYDATRAIRALPRPDAAKIPIVAMTANAFAEDVRASREAGLNAHIPKPLDIPYLKETLLRILSGEKPK